MPSQAGVRQRRAGFVCPHPAFSVSALSVHAPADCAIASRYLTVKRSIFRYLPGNGSSIIVSNNGMRRTNAQAARMQHSEGVITISAFNNSIRILRNTVINAPVPFISRLHADMRDWIIRGNTVYGTQGVFLAKVWPGSALTDVVWEDNAFFNTGEGRTIWNPGAELITGFSFRNNRIIGGNLRLDRLTASEVTGNIIKSCNVAPLAITNGTNMVVSGNSEDRQYCALRVRVTASPGAVVRPGGSVVFTVAIDNTADPVDAVTAAGITVRTLTESLSGRNIGASCSPRLPAVLRAGEALSCSLVRQISGAASVSVNFTAMGKISNGSPVQGSGAARVRINN